MSQQTKQSLIDILEKEGPKVKKFIGSGEPTESKIKDYYDKVGQNVTKNAVKQMLKHLKTSY